MCLAILLVLAALARQAPVVDPCDRYCSECVADCLEACEERCTGECTLACHRGCKRRCRTCPAFCREHPWIKSLPRREGDRRP